jgi:hypothetical protein
MSMSENPYESPVTAELVVDAQVLHTDGLWRKGHLLVMRKTARMPNRCVKSNQPTERRLRRSLSWHHPAIFLTILAGVLVYIIVALILTKRATIYIGLSNEWFAKRRRVILIAWTIVLASIAMFVLGFAWIDQNDAAGWLILAGFLGFMIGAIYGLVGARMVAPTRIDDEFVWLKGVSREFLADLPEWPYRW